jgi:hypothetical protein
MITKRVETLLIDRYGHKELDKRRIMGELLKRFDTWKALKDLPPDVQGRAEKLFAAINSAFEGKAKETAKIAA